MAENNDKTVFVVREKVEKDGKTYSNYYIYGSKRGRDFKIGLLPPDSGGYIALDIVFDQDDKLPLVVKPYEIRDEKTRKVTRGNTYAVVSKDKETGETLEAQVKLARKSDKDLLDMLFKKAA